MVHRLKPNGEYTYHLLQLQKLHFTLSVNAWATYVFHVKDWLFSEIKWLVRILKTKLSVRQHRIFVSIHRGSVLSCIFKATHNAPDCKVHVSCPLVYLYCIVTSFHLGVNVDSAQPQFLILIQHAAWRLAVQPPVRLDVDIATTCTQHGGSPRCHHLVQCVTLVSLYAIFFSRVSSSSRNGVLRSTE